MRHRTTLPDIALDRNAREPLHGQLRETLRRAIAAGKLPAGTALPSTRSLAERLGISRNTVLTAYEELAAEGLVSGEAGSATRVEGAHAAPRPLNWRRILRAAQYPARRQAFSDPDGNALYFHR